MTTYPPIALWDVPFRRVVTCDSCQLMPPACLHFSVVGTVRRPRAEQSGFRLQQSRQIFLCCKISRLAVRPILSPMQSASVALSPGVKQTGFEADHCHSSHCKVKNEWSYTTYFFTCLPGTGGENVTITHMRQSFITL